MRLFFSHPGAPFAAAAPLCPPDTRPARHRTLHTTQIDTKKTNERIANRNNTCARHPTLFPPLLPATLPPPAAGRAACPPIPTHTPPRPRRRRAFGRLRHRRVACFVLGTGFVVREKERRRRQRRWAENISLPHTFRRQAARRGGRHAPGGKALDPLHVR